MQARGSRSLDPYLLLAELALMGLSFVGVGSQDPHLLPALFLRLALALAVTYLCSRIPVVSALQWGRWIWLLCAILLASVLLVGPQIGGVRRWLILPDGLSLQPSELVKVGLILYLAAYAGGSRRRRLSAGPRAILAVALSVLLVALEPDLGTAALILVLGLALLLWSGVPAKQLLIGLGLLALLGLLAVALGHGHYTYALHRLQRYLSALRGGGPASTPYQLRIAHQMIAQAGWFGRGFRHKVPALPAGYTDMVSAAVIYAGGWVSGGLLALAMAVVVWRGILLTLRCQGSERALAFGVSAYIAIQALTNLLVLVGTIPVTGVPLPMVSYGGSAMVSAGAALGFLQAIHRRNSWR